MDLVDSLKLKAELLPLLPGVYQFEDETGRVVYVGKAKQLKKRVLSYFSGSHTPRVQAMLNQARGLEITVTETEHEALILEANLIKRFRPPYNVLLKDDKSHPYLHLTLEHSFPRLSLYRGNRKESGRFFGPYPSVHAVRETLKWLQKIFPIRQCGEMAFANRSRPCLQYQIKRCSGPCCGRVSGERYREWVGELILFLEGKDRMLEKSLKKNMWEASQRLEFEAAAHLRDRLHFMAQVQDKRRLNLSWEVDLDVVCMGKDGVDIIQFLFIRGGLHMGSRHYFPANPLDLSPGEVMESFLAQYYSDEGHRQDAGVGISSSYWPPGEILVNSTMEDPEWLMAVLSRLSGAGVRVWQPQKGEKRRLLEMGEKNASEALSRQARVSGDQGELLRQLGEVLGMDASPERIEAYDISHFQGSKPTGSLVVFGPKGFDKKSYRRYAIRQESLEDDTARMREVLTRRFMALKEDGGSGREGVAWPDLILLDGGVGQLHAVMDVAQEMQVDGVVLCAMAKGPDRHAGREKLFLPESPSPIILPENSQVLFLLQRIRDEAHRFAVGFHRVRRQKEQRRSALDDIPGIGPQKKRALLRRFGSVKAIREAGMEELVTVEGVSLELAQRIEHYLKV